MRMRRGGDVGGDARHGLFDHMLPNTIHKYCRVVMLTLVIYFEDLFCFKILTWEMMNPPLQYPIECLKMR